VATDEASARLAATQLYRIGLDGLRGWISPGEWERGGGEVVPAERVQFTDFDAAAASADDVIIDVRTSAEFADGHLAGALSIPYTRLRERLSEVPRGKKLHVHCGSGKRAALAASYLVAQGYPAVHVDGVCAECERIADTLGVTH
jgi:hydroxyacylglutathione hydrolase